MILVTGDTHGEQNRFSLLKEYQEPKWIADDYLIICGDFGYIFANNEKENAFLDELAKKPYTICFIDGNHENFPVIYRYPTELWNGGRIHRIRQNVIHLMRGQVFEIDGKLFFTMGGAYSIDRYMRYEGLSYWTEELPDNSEYKEASKNLKECGFKAIIAFLESTNYEDAIRNAVSLGGDSDTLAAITGAIAWSYYRFGDRTSKEANKKEGRIWPEFCDNIILKNNIDNMLPDDFAETIEQLDIARMQRAGTYCRTGSCSQILLD